MIARLASGLRIQYDEGETKHPAEVKMRLVDYIQSVLHPERFHGDVLTPPFFEGWYIKLVTADLSEAYAFIPGISITKDGAGSHAFVQVLNGTSGAVQVVDYGVEDFYWDPRAFDVHIGGSHFSLEGINLDLTTDSGRISGNVRFGKMIPWPVMFQSPGVMGPFGWLPFMECNHGVLGLDHALEGALHFGDRVVDFTGGRGYIEKDWGSAFPKRWIWMQTNHFSQVGTSLVGSVAVVPMMGFAFNGLIVGLYHQGRLHAFTTYNGAKVIQQEMDDNGVELVFERGSERLWVRGTRKSGGVLKAPTLAGMDRRIVESLDGKILVKYWQNNHLVLEDEGRRAGLEIVGW
jgi:tocopherol cyclase